MLSSRVLRRKAPHDYGHYLESPSPLNRAVQKDHFCDTTKRASQRLPPPLKRGMPLYHRSGEKTLDPGPSRMGPWPLHFGTPFLAGRGDSRYGHQIHFAPKKPWETRRFVGIYKGSDTETRVSQVRNGFCPSTVKSPSTRFGASCLLKKGCLVACLTKQFRWSNPDGHSIVRYWSPLLRGFLTGHEQRMGGVRLFEFPGEKSHGDLGSTNTRPLPRYVSWLAAQATGN